MTDGYLGVVLSKAGPELFKELLRLYPLAEIEDYYKQGQWQTEVLRLDIQIIYSHREEAGALDPLPYEQIVMPALPGVPSWIAMQGQQAAATGAAPAAGAPFTMPAAMTQLTQQMMPAELQLVVNFSNKHNLDMLRCKTILSTLPGHEARKKVMIDFTPKEGEDTLKQLEAKIAELKPAAVPATNGLNALKRPFELPPGLDPSKRLAFLASGTATKPTSLPVTPGQVISGILPGIRLAQTA
mmetsp:Transcript_16072/g.25685  ORF Transcript_16072/g.25685 Transcript_16072/m.25685 type:complete len:241 (-) Transcript_16072:57-779(-)